MPIKNPSNSADALWDRTAPLLDETTPVLIAGATASGKSSLALRIAQTFGGVIVNADAMQVYACWSVLTARPSAGDEARVSHLLYGHIDGMAAHTVGDWLRSVRGVLSGPPMRPIIVGGTGLFFRALTEGLAQIPPIPTDVTRAAEAMCAERGLSALVQDLDAATVAGLDVNNPVRVQRAWAVQRATGRSIRAWQADTPAPDLPLPSTIALHLDAHKDWLTPRIAGRFDRMWQSGAIEEVTAARDIIEHGPLAAHAIGAQDILAFLNGTLTASEAQQRAVTATCQYAKRQRTWFRKRMTGWHKVPLV